MQNFIVLGYVPGTHIQINFTGWLIVFCSLVLSMLIIRSRWALRTWLMAWLVARVIRHTGRSSVHVLE